MNCALLSGERHETDVISSVPFQLLLEAARLLPTAIPTAIDDQPAP